MYEYIYTYIFIYIYIYIETIGWWRAQGLATYEPFSAIYFVDGGVCGGSRNVDARLPGKGN